MHSKIMALWNAAMVAGAADSTFVPAGLTFAQYSTANFLTAVKKVKAVNNAYGSGVIAFGDIIALSPPLIVERAEIDRIVETIRAVLTRLD